MLQRIGVWISREGDRLYYRRHTTNGSISGAATEADHEGGIMTSRLPPHGNRVFVCRSISHVADDVSGVCIDLADVATSQMT